MECYIRVEVLRVIHFMESCFSITESITGSITGVQLSIVISLITGDIEEDGEHNSFETEGVLEIPWHISAESCSIFTSYFPLNEFL